VCGWFLNFQWEASCFTTRRFGDDVFGVADGLVCCFRVCYQPAAAQFLIFFVFISVMWGSEARVCIRIWLELGLLRVCIVWPHYYLGVFGGVPYICGTGCLYFSVFSASGYASCIY